MRQGLRRIENRDYVVCAHGNKSRYIYRKFQEVSYGNDGNEDFYGNMHDAGAADDVWGMLVSGRREKQNSCRLFLH